MIDSHSDTQVGPDLFNSLLVSLLMGRRVAVLLGTVEHGRSRLLRRLADHIGAGGALVLTTDARPDMGMRDLVLAAARPPGGNQDFETLATFIDAELEAAGMGILVIDRAELLDPAVIRDLFNLAATDSPTGRYLQIVLAGTAGLERSLHHYGLADALLGMGLVYDLSAAPEPAPTPSALPFLRPPASLSAPKRHPGGKRSPLRWSVAALFAVLTGVGAGAALLPARLPADLLPEFHRPAPPQPPAITFRGPVNPAIVVPVAPAESIQDEPLTDEPAKDDPPAPAPPIAATPEPGTPPLPPRKAPVPPTRASGDTTRNPPLALTRSSAQREAPRQTADACRQGEGGARAPDASLSGVAQGFLADVRSLGRCMTDLLGN
jgi:hypothetical protein